MTLYFMLSKTFEGFHLVANSTGFAVVLGWLSFGASLVHAGHATAKLTYQQDLLIAELGVLQHTLQEVCPEEFERLYGSEVVDTDKEEIDDSDLN